MRRLAAVLAFGGLAVFQGLAMDVAFAADGDSDLVDDAIDVCPTVADPLQGDIDGDGVGDLCEDATGVTTFEGTPEGELILGTEEDDTLAGAGGDDAIYGLGGDDTIDGGDGRDFLSGGPGADTLTGGPGCDVFAVDPAGGQDVITDFDVEIDRVTFGAAVADSPAPAPSFGGEENLLVTFASDTEGELAALEFEGLPAGVEISLLSGPCATPSAPEEVLPPEEPPFICSPLYDFEEPLEAYDIVFPFDGKQVDGTSANETLTGTDCSDVIAGDVALGIGDEFVEEALCADGVCGDDIIFGLGGNDLLVGDKTYLDDGEVGGNDTIHGGQGDDLIVGDAAFIGLCDCGGVGGVVAGDVGGAISGHDELFGDEGDDAMFGDAVEVLSGFSFGGDDYMDGGDGDDLLIGDGIVILDGAEAGDDILLGGAGDDEIYGDAGLGIDEFSFAGHDDLTGGAGDDLLFGDAPNMDGEAGNDTFHYDATSDFGDDVIADGGSREILDYIAFSGLGSTDIADLDARSTVTDDGFDVLAVVFTDNTKLTQIGSILIANIGTGSTTSWVDIDGSPTIDVIVA